MINRSLEHVIFITKHLHYLLFETQEISEKFAQVQAVML